LNALDFGDVVKLKVALIQILQISQLFKSDSVVRHIQRSQVLKVAQVFLDDVYYVLRGQL